MAYKDPIVAGRITSRAWDYLQQALSDFQSGRGSLSGFYKDFLGGPWLKRFEETFAKYIGTKYAIGVSSGTAALHIAQEALFSDDEPVTLTSPMTFVASATSIFMTGGIPVFSDVDNYLTLDPANYHEEYEVLTPEVIIPVHLLGQPCNMDLIRETFPDAHIIEDCAQSLGATYQGKMTGSIGDLGCFSFQETKSLTTLGEGGMVTTNDPDLAKRCQALRNHGEKYAKANQLGYNYRMTEPEAAFGLGQLEEYDKTLATQRACARIVRKKMGSHPLTPLEIAPSTDPSFFIVAAMFNDPAHNRDAWIESAQKVLSMTSPTPGRTIGKGYTELVPDLPLFGGGKFPNARKLMKQMVWFDIHRFTDEETVRARMDQLQEIYT